MALLEVADLEVRYGHALALDGVSLTVGAGELVGVLGPNGAGKTTLLKAISRTVPPASGRVTFDGRALDRLPAHKVVGRGICHCPEGRRLFPELTVHKNLMLGAWLRRDQHGIAKDLDKVLSLFPVLRERAGQQANTLSGGEQQMLAIGRALMGAPKLLLLDEPSVGIAQRLKIEIFQSIRAIQQAGTAVLLVEQDARSTLAVAERVYVLEHGRVVRRGDAGALASDDDIRRIYLGI
ncbi:MAG: ABC transporter ATP-binding protein [Bradyrhizobiaceae bacterium]|nr:ABC transporter ATP-binding protein [Bradyrhizobiaceae bacterium]